MVSQRMAQPSQSFVFPKVTPCLFRVKNPCTLALTDVFLVVYVVIVRKLTFLTVWGSGLVIGFASGGVKSVFFDESTSSGPIPKFWGT